MAREISPTEAIANGHVRVTEPPDLFARLVEMFRIEPMPAA